MNVLLFGASGRIGRRIAAELLDRGHNVVGITRSGDIDIDDSDFKAAAGNATDVDEVARLAAGRDVVVSALGPGKSLRPGVYERPDTLSEMAKALIEGLRQTDVDRLVWTGGAGVLKVAPDKRLIETDEFPAFLVPIAQAHIDAFEVIQGTEDIRWSYVAPPAVIEAGERTGQYRTAVGELVVDEDDESYISMEDFAVAFVDELENGNAIHTPLGVGY